MASVPESVVIPAGKRSTALPLLGLQAGVDEIQAEAGEEGYIRSDARIQVSPLSNVRLDVIASEPASLQIRATDVNLIPYPGLRILVSTNSGSVSVGDTAVTGADGIARLRWTPESKDGAELRVTLEDGTGAVTVRVP